MKGIPWRLVAPLALLLLAVTVPSAGLAVANTRDAHGEELSDFDARAGKVAPTAAQKAEVRRLRAAVTWNRFGTPASLIRYRGRLGTGVKGTAGAAARTWLLQHRGLFRLRSAAGLRYWQTHGLGSRGRVVLLRQTFRGLAAMPDGLVAVTLRREGSGWAVVHVSSSLTGDSRLSGRARLSPREAVYRAARNVGDATSLADVHTVRTQGGWTLMRLEGVPGPQRARLIAVPTPRGGTVPGYQTIITSLVEGADSAFQFIVDARNGRILMRNNLVDHLADNPRWKVFPAYPIVGGSQYPWNYPSTDIREIWCWTAAPGCAYLPSEGAPPPKQAWDVQPPGMTPTNTMDGNNGKAWETWDGGPGIGPEVPPAERGFYLPGPNMYAPVTPTREYIYPFQNVWFETECAQTNYMPPGSHSAGRNDIEAAVANLFVQHNRMHDWSWWLGFNEQRWNAQDVNFGTTVSPPPPWLPSGPPTAANDGLIGDVQEAARSGGPPGQYGARDNANMLTLPDGTSSITNMYLWQPLAGAFYAPCVDGDYDGAVIGHEYGHMIENRMIGKGVRRQGHHAGAMGESFGDLVGMEYLNEYGFVPVTDENPYSVGAYATSNKYRAIRNYGMNFPYAGGIPRPSRYPFVDPLNFSDIGYDIVARQVHADGEIWSATNFDIRRVLIEKYGFGGTSRQRECADGKRPPEQCPGNRRWIQLYFDAMAAVALTRPSMLDMRNAILAADMARFGGANQRELWWAFATRGFGRSATVSPPPLQPAPPATQLTGADDAQPKAAFDSPHEENATVTFRAFASDEGRAPVNATVYVGHYEARVSPIADTNPATAGTVVPGLADPNNLDNVALFAPRRYELVAHAPGYGHLRFRARFRPGETRTIDLFFATNWASRHKGAVASGDGVRHSELIDDTESTNWQVTGWATDVDQTHPRVTVDLAGGTHKLKQAAVSAYLVPTVDANEVASATQNRFTALRQFELLGCRAGASSANPTCLGTNTAGWTSLYRSSERFFPGDTPRPVAPELLLRGFKLSGHWEWDGRDDREKGDKRGDDRSGRVTHVQLVVLDNQCTGNPAFQGEQDQDPDNITDCRLGSPSAALPPRGRDVRATELQLYTSKHRVKGAQLAEGGDDDDEDDDDD
jgi:extracellular elastinolytic metalloproteinase